MVQPHNNNNNHDVTQQLSDNGIINLSHGAALHQIRPIVGYEKYYETVFDVLSKKNRNNIAVCGQSGVGKTAFVRNLANLIYNGQCHPNFSKKMLIELDFSKFVIGTPLKGAFEKKFYTMINKARTHGNCIFFIDNLHHVLNGTSKYAETDTETLFDALLSEPSIQLITTLPHKIFKNMCANTSLGKYFQEVLIEEPSTDECVNILNEIKAEYESYHDVIYDESSIRTCVELCSKYFKEHSLPESAIDLIDAAGGKKSIVINENALLTELKDEFNFIVTRINEIKSSPCNTEYDKIDELTKREIELKTKISIAEKEERLSKEPSIVTKNDICSVISQRIGIPLDELTQNEKERLKGLNERLKQKIIGQDEAVDEVSMAVKRQRVGLGENERPAVLMFLGSTGTGKTYLAKQLSKEVFGDEKYFVRIDMSEYSDKTSVTKIGGSSPGYVGYDNDTQLVKTLKKHKRFVLLLDEFEKSNEEVHDVFLQIFDEGRFTDNHGIEYSLKDVIIIMTSNIGVTEAAYRGKQIGFGNNGYDMSQTIIEKELKKKFKPEFLNRIQKIVYFNKLTEANLRSIIQLEIQKIETKVNKMGYRLSSVVTGTKMCDLIYGNIVKLKDYGARPIVNEVQRQLEDKIVDYIINNEVEEGHIFTFQELSNLVKQ